MPMRIKIKELEPYDGTLNAKLLGNFCWGIELYLEQLNISSDECCCDVIENEC
jgi:hypothetical protein